MCYSSWRVKNRAPWRVLHALYMGFKTCFETSASARKRAPVREPFFWGRNARVTAILIKMTVIVEFQEILLDKGKKA
jgi:hypothetical protein